MLTIHSFLRPMIPTPDLLNMVTDYIGIDGFAESAGYELIALDKLIKSADIKECIPKKPTHPSHLRWETQIFIEPVESVNYREVMSTILLKKIAAIMEKNKGFVCTKYTLITLENREVLNFALILTSLPYAKDFCKEIAKNTKVSTTLQKILQERAYLKETKRSGKGLC